MAGLFQQVIQDNNMMNVDAIHTIIGIIGNITSFIRLASPMPTMFRFLKKKSVEEFTFHPYVAGIMNCVLWVFYSMPFVHPHSIPVTTVNCIGLFMNVSYVIVYWIYTVKSKRNEIKLLFSPCDARRFDCATKCRIIISSIFMMKKV